MVCKSGEETILHILRDYPAMAGEWNRLVPPRRIQTFFSKFLLEWIYGNLGDDTKISGCLWATISTQAVWRG